MINYYSKEFFKTYLKQMFWMLFLKCFILVMLKEVSFIHVNFIAIICYQESEFQLFLK